MMPVAVPPLSPMDTGPSGRQAKAMVALYRRTLDVLQGYTTMVERTDPSFRDTAERFRALHSRHVETLARLLAAQGIEADGNGSANCLAVAARAFPDRIDADVTGQIRGGENRVLDAFDAAIEEQSGTGNVVSLRDMRHELTRLLSETAPIR